MAGSSEIIFYNGEAFEVPEWAEHIALNPDGSYVVLRGTIKRDAARFWKSDGHWEYILPITEAARPMRIERKSKQEI